MSQATNMILVVGVVAAPLLLLWLAGRLFRRLSDPIIDDLIERNRLSYRWDKPDRQRMDEIGAAARRRYDEAEARHV